MKQLAVGILAHVDAGKTTLSEALLYAAGLIKTPGRVDHKNAFLDTDSLERERGITIFSKQAVLPLEGCTITLLDTPGHVDFSAEAERTLQVLDYAVLVISGTDGVQSHTETVWRLLKKYKIPTFLFVNKMDIARQTQAEALAGLKQRLHESCLDFTEGIGDGFFESLALCGEQAMEEYLQKGSVVDETICQLIAARKVFPCFFGSALKLQGVSELLQGLQRYTKAPVYPVQFGAKVYKTSRDSAGTRLTHMKITGGSLQVKDVLSGGSGEEAWQQKADSIRIYSGEKYKNVSEASAGSICAVTGLGHTHPGQGLGNEAPSPEPLLAPVLTYQLLLPAGADVPATLAALAVLEEEDPQLRVVWKKDLGEIHLQVMGEVQLEVLSVLLKERFDLDAKFGTGSIVYKETIENTVEGVGHFEPLRHYAEVHLLLKPGAPGSGPVFTTQCSEDVLDKNWQQQVLNHLGEKQHRGVLTGAAVTDINVALATGRGHTKHTEGGDFREAAHRALRQGLMQAQSVLLEPWYEFRLEVPAEAIGHAMADVQRMSGEFEGPEPKGDTALLKGSCPVATMQGYARQVAAYTKGQGRLHCISGGYRPCHNAAEIIKRTGYDPERDVENTPDSVFCSHGAGYIVKWNEVARHMHCESVLKTEPPNPPPQKAPPTRRAAPGSLEEDKQLKAIFEKTYGTTLDNNLLAQSRKAPPPQEYIWQDVPEYLLVDGYNIIFDWPILKTVAAENLAAARQMLMDILSNYQGFKKCGLVLVFDAYKVAGGTQSIDAYEGIHVVYTKEAETADAYIEKTTYSLAKKHKVRVATSDGAEQMIILGHGALRMSAAMLWQEVQLVKRQIDEIVWQHNQAYRPRQVEAALEKAKRKKQDK